MHWRGRSGSPFFPGHKLVFSFYFLWSRAWRMAHVQSLILSLFQSVLKWGPVLYLLLVCYRRWHCISFGQEKALSGIFCWSIQGIWYCKPLPALSEATWYRCRYRCMWLVQALPIREKTKSVKLRSYHCECLSVTKGPPQGSILGPVLITIISTTW